MGSILDVADIIKQINGNKELMAQIAKANGIKVILSSITPCEQYRWRKEVTDVIQKIQSLNARIRDYAKKNKFQYVDYCSPEEFLWLIDHAKLVISSSFHGNVFSILFHKPFITILPPNEPKNERNYYMLKMLHIEDHLFTGNADGNVEIKQPEWNVIDKILEEQKEQSINYIQMIANI